MKSPYFTADHDTFRDTVRQFLQKEVAPNAEKWEEERRIPKSIWKRMGDLGFLGINFPEAYGGTGADFFYSVVFLEELAHSTMGGFVAAVSVHEYMASEYLYKFAGSDLKKKYLMPAIRGEKIGALAITEPNTGSDVAAIRTRAVRRGEHYIINGSKTFITNGVFGDFVLVAAKTDADAGVGGISLILVERETAGFTARPLHKIGWHSSDTGELHFDDVMVPASNLIGEEDRGFYYIMECFQLERLVGAIGSLGGAYLCMEGTLKYITERQAFGKPLAKFQVIRHALADLKTELEAARCLTYHTAWLHSNRQQVVQEASMAKLLTTELAKKMADTCLQFFGGYGYMDEYLISRMYRDSRVGTIVGGTSEIMREIIARIMIDQVSYRPVREKTASTAAAPKDEPKKAASKEPPNAPREEAVKKEKAEPLPTTAREIILTLPARFQPDRAGDWETLFHFDLSGSGGGQFTVRIKDRTCQVESGLLGQAKCIVKASDNTYRDLELGKANPEVAFMMGKIKISNLAEMMQFTKMFKKLKKT